MAKTMSISELEKQLAAKRGQAEKLQAKRDDLAARLEHLDRQLAELTGAAAPTAKRTPKRTPKRAKAAKRAKRAGRAAKGGKTLTDYIQQVLADAGEPMRAKAVEQAVRAAGYPTTAKDFYGTVAAALRNEELFQRVGRGVYKLRG